MIYADNAATTKMSEAAVHTMISVINEDYGNPSSLYSIGQQAKETLEEARKTVAEAIGAEPREKRRATAFLSTLWIMLLALFRMVSSPR